MGGVEMKRIFKFHALVLVPILSFSADARDANAALVIFPDQYRHDIMAMTIAFQLLQFITFIALLILFWRASKWPRWRLRVIIYGWALVFLWAFLRAAILPFSLRNVMDSKTIADTFPDGTIVMGALAGGWFWPLIVVLINNHQSCKKN